MGSQAPISSRTYWTPTMERYFIDLMLKHMHRGNRTGHTFNRQAWTDMLTVFNEKFASQYDKDVLKGHYTRLWKQFNEIKNLLGQSGFSWDDNQQMVVADDFVWDAFIKVHPDARPYKTKAVMNFNDLCLIYGYTTADGRYSRSSHDIDNEDDIQGVNLGDGMGCLIPSSGERSRTDWTTDMDQYFIELMLNQQERGNKLDVTFSKQAWTDMLASFNTKFGPQHSKRVLRHRYKKLLKYYSDVRVLLKQNGFSWDESQQMVSADDNVWQPYVKAHPNARAYRSRILPNYKDLVRIFGDAADADVQRNSCQDVDLEGGISAIKAGGERSRTYWTPPMDRFLIDLLLDQVQKGNRIGQTYISQAWIDMIGSFNARFKSHYDKDVLKNRYKHLRKQYNEVKVLLEQNGFSWDETREMVTAKDHVWDTYTKAHPDARSYRVKTVPSYHKLSIIYGYDSSDGRYGHLAQSVEQKAEAPLLMTDWTPPMDRYFVDLMLEQVHKAKRDGHTFNEQAWISMSASIHEKFSLQCDKHVLEDRYMYLMEQYSDISNLLNESGFGWDETQQILLADDAVWNAYVKEHPDAVTYKSMVLGYYNDLCVIFGSGMVDEELSCQSQATDIDFRTLNIEIDDFSGCIQIPVTHVESPDCGKKRPAMIPSALEQSSKVPKTSEGAEEHSADMATVVTKFSSQQDVYVSVENAIDALQAIPDIDDDLLLDACDLLEDDKKAKTFLALDATLRRKWLLRKLGR